MFIFCLIALGAACQGFFELNPNAINENQYPSDVTSECIIGYIGQNKWDIVNYLLATFKEDTDLTQVIDYLSQQKKQLTKIINLLDVPVESQNVPPSFRWAQSTTHIYIDVKFSHRIDAAGCVDIHNFSQKVSEKHLSVEGQCIMSGHKILFDLELDFFKEVDENDVEVNEGNSGRLEFKIAKKKTPDVWKTLYEGEKPKTISIWYDMQETFKKQLDAYHKKEGL
ncbi:hypothetical protein SteCoe_372 [Stentor coeruleus]|uniref:CS domain-containing protein n=1 Tax=Stentor coeruleus TaxID=5963 RepID=A0A1R2D409_9CILI|nr:hypothetical protein SteCoe_372 [Stentor coeruleus]